jgi:hypothetical protein
VLCRKPTESELAALEGVYQQAIERYRDDAAGRRRLVAERQLPRKDVASAAAWFNVAQILLNLDEAITKN